MWTNVLDVTIPHANDLDTVSSSATFHSPTIEPTTNVGALITLLAFAALTLKSVGSPAHSLSSRIALGARQLFHRKKIMPKLMPRALAQLLVKTRKGDLHTLPARATSAKPDASQPSTCRFCGEVLNHSVIDLGAQPLSNCYLRREDLRGPEATWPLHAFVCQACFLVQIDATETPERIFTDYAYFSSYSVSWLKHVERYADNIIDRLKLDQKSQVIEIASNDGYLLKNFTARGIPALGIEPAKNVAAVATSQGISTRNIFLNISTAQQIVQDGYRADLLIGNNVLAHVPTLNDFVKALHILLKPSGTLTMEFPHLLRLIEDTQFDTIYHEHFSYFSLLTAEKIFAVHGLRIFDVECLPTHGGSLRIYAARAERGDDISQRVCDLKERERNAGLEIMGTYDLFADRVRKTKRSLIRFLIDAKENGKSIVAYGAAAKGNTLLNYCGAGSDIIDYVVDANPHKQGLYLPGTRIPIDTPERLRETRPDYVLILPWNLAEEIVSQHDYIREWGGQFVLPVPKLTVFAPPQSEPHAA